MTIVRASERYATRARKIVTRLTGGVLVTVETAGRVALHDDVFPRISKDALTRVPYALAARYNVLPYHADGGDLHIFVGDVTDDEVLDRVRSATGMHIVPKSAPASALRAKIAAVYGFDDAPDERGDAPPAIRCVDEIQYAAVCARASDIHIEPTAGGGRVRQRVDGILSETRQLSAELLAQTVSRVKLLAGMDIADRRRPQDGRYHVDVQGRSIDARVSSMPTIAGEKLVIRLLDMHANIPSLEHLGMPTELLNRYRALVHAPYGFIVVCGPTGSGKTTTLYASISERNVSAQQLCTVEDPVEVRMPGVAQVQVNERAGVTFASALRSFLRQDPNVLMVGEMRDAETAKVALSAALSGQLVLTTLHAADSCRAVERLAELGLARQAIAAGLSGIVAQRLVRRLCVSCREFVATPFSSYEPRGCKDCSRTGYRGRTGIFEYFSVSSRVREAIASGESSVGIAASAQQSGYRPMLEDGLQLVRRGETSLQELRRVLSVEVSQ